MKKWQKIALFIIAAVVLLAVRTLLFERLSYHSPSGSGSPANTPVSGGETIESSPVLTVTGGLLSGKTENGVFSFLGVPYATVGGRFAEPEGVHWEGVREATQYGPSAPQTPFAAETAEQEKNCLNLNIWTNGVEDGAKRPVMVWFHGGSMVIGSANEAQTNGRNLAAAEDVVVVSVNHRLGVLGFLDLSAYGEQYARSGNLGVLDMIAALKWVRANIEVFGGDPENVTIFGQSGGGAKVLALMTSPYAEGLFHKAINQSGATDTMGCAFAPKEITARVTELTLEHLNISGDNLEKLQDIPLSDLDMAGTAALQQVSEEFGIISPFANSGSYAWMPCVDGDVIPTNPVLEEGFAASGRNIPLLIGSNLNEWRYVLGRASEDRDAVLSTLRFRYGDSAMEILKAFQAAYPNVSIGNALLVDTEIRPPLLKVTAHKADQGGAPVYSYMLTYGSPRALHGTEIPLVFDNATPHDKEMAGILRKIWAQFARTGDPSIEGLPSWIPFTRESGAVMVLDRASYLNLQHDEALLRLLRPDYEW